MGTLVANWHDEAKSRTINFSVAYEICSAGQVNISDIIPDHVTIVCPESNTTLKTMSVYTAKGRQMLANQIRNSTRMEDLKREILERRSAAANV
ncbi:MAG: hypothetical protein KF851_18375 [Pirellulaceae bacterium]|jgi:hypothetical protein|nr:hypothetical protein [Pirellulaceae bacterium]